MKVLLLLLPCCLLGITDISLGDPPTFYIQWLDSISTPMDSADGDNSYSLDPYLGGAATQLLSPMPYDIYIGAMCNQKSGYEIFLQANGGGATITTGKLFKSGATSITYTASLTKVASTFSSGAVASTNIDLTGSTPSCEAVFDKNNDVPRKIADANVYHLSLSLPQITSVTDGLIMEGTYSGSITATISAK